MPTCNINLTPKFDTFVASRIENGRYEIAGKSSAPGSARSSVKTKITTPGSPRYPSPSMRERREASLRATFFARQRKSRQLRSSKTNANSKIDSQ